MLTKEKRSALIAGMLAVVMVMTGCGSQPEEKEEEQEETNHLHSPVYIPVNSSGSTSNTSAAGITSSSKPPASSPKVAAPASGKTGISTGAARSSAVS